MAALRCNPGFHLDGENWVTIWGKPRDSSLARALGIKKEPSEEQGEGINFERVRKVIAASWFCCLSASLTAWETAKLPFDKYWIYLSHQGAALEAVYFCMAAWTTSEACRMAPDSERGSTPWFVKLTWALSELVPVLATTITVGFWAPVALGMSSLTIDDIARNLHGLNFAWVIADGMICRRPKFRPMHFYVPMLYLLGYTFFSYVYFQMGGTDWQGNHYIYNFLDWGNNAKGTAKIVGLLCFVGTPLLYFAFALVTSESCQDLIGLALQRGNSAARILAQEGGQELRTNGAV